MKRGWLAALAVVTGFGQSGPVFDVATIKPSDPQSAVMNASGFAPERFTATGTLRDFLKLAYGVLDTQISGGPGWLNSDRFNIDARTGKPASPNQMRAMLQTLLADRFKLTVHHENRELPVYALAIGKDGPKLKAVERAGGMSSGPGMIRGQVPLSSLVRYLSQTLERTVIDRTGMAGAFEIKLEWMPEEESVFTAIQEQLGLQLESTKAAVDVLVIDRTERPSGN